MITRRSLRLALYVFAFIFSSVCVFPEFLSLLEFNGSSPGRLLVASSKSLNNYLVWGSSLDFSSVFSIRWIPNISIFIFTIFLKIFGFGVAIFIIKFAVFFLSFLLIYKIFEQYMRPVWSIGLSILSLGAYSDFPFRNFLKSFSAGSMETSLDLGIFPNPGISFFIFILGIYFIIKKVKYTEGQYLILSLFWGLQVYVLTSNFLVGFPIWFFNLFQREQRGENLKKIFIQNLIVVIVTILPAVFSFLSFKSNFLKVSEGLNIPNKMGIATELASNHSILYFFIPLVLISIVFVFRRVDPYELYKKFGYIYLLLFLETVFIFLDHMFYSGGITLALFSRLFIFLHFLYLIPVVYYVERDSNINFRKGIVANKHVEKVRELIRVFSKSFGNILLPILVLLNLFFIFQVNLSLFKSSEKIFQSKKSFSKKINVKKLEGLVLTDDHFIAADLVSKNLLTKLAIPLSHDSNHLNSGFELIALSRMVFNRPNEIIEIPVKSNFKLMGLDASQGIGQVVKKYTKLFDLNTLIKKFKVSMICSQNSILSDSRAFKRRSLGNGIVCLEPVHWR